MHKKGLIDFNIILNNPLNSSPLLVALLDGVPVDHIPPGLDVIGASVLVVQVVSVLPDVDGQEGAEAHREGVSGVMALPDGELPVLVRAEPHPPARKVPGGLVAEGLLEGLEGAKVPHDRVVELPRGGRGFGVLGGAEAVPVEGVVPRLGGGVVGALGHLLGPAGDDAVEGALLVGGPGDNLVELGDVAPVVLVVVEVDDSLADVGLEGVLGVGKVLKNEAHC